MGCIADKKKPLITVHCSKRTTMPTITEHKNDSNNNNINNITDQNKTKYYISSSIINEDKHTYKSNKNISYGDSEWVNCVIHEAPNTKESFKDKLMHEITELEKGEKQKHNAQLNWENSNSNVNTLSNTRMNSERGGKKEEYQT